ncbi:DUF6199 family natural product biosynthesis protein [Streptomyces venezuelae]|uniref:DUF6199 family natural product biosynthesis protein n=1 Tax=Streptomyces venezuelae TaxID=54571 RepID=UPI001CC24AFF|nr:DUF6199 family natural product biosynthesis protein [Streptomyces venezuelae]
MMDIEHVFSPRLRTLSCVPPRDRLGSGGFPEYPGPLAVTHPSRPAAPFSVSMSGQPESMNHDGVVQAASDGNPAVVPLLCLFMIMGLVQVVRPQLLWKVNKNLQRGWVKDPDATEPTAKGYAMERAIGVIFLAGVVWMLVTQV